MNGVLFSKEILHCFLKWGSAAVDNGNFQYCHSIVSSLESLQVLRQGQQ